MYRIEQKKILNENVTLMQIKAPLVANKAKPGQFIVFRLDEKGERVPLTISDIDKKAGNVTIIFQIVGQSTYMLNQLNEGDSILDFLGPLGLPTPLRDFKKVCLIGGGVGSAIIYPQAKELHEKGSNVDVILGFRGKEHVILEEEMRKVSDQLFITTDDGTYGIKGLVTDQLQKLLDEGNTYDTVIAIGPVPMMKYVSLLTKRYEIPTIVSLNSIMVDGTGMCGSCRVTVDGETKFACVDGPDFDGHLVDFDSLEKRNNIYHDIEEEKYHECRLLGGLRGE